MQDFVTFSGNEQAASQQGRRALSAFGRLSPQGDGISAGALQSFSASRQLKIGRGS